MNVEGYWKSTFLDGTIKALFKANNQGNAWIFKNGEWKERDAVWSQFGIDFDYDKIDETEANQIMEMLK